MSRRMTETDWAVAFLACLASQIRLARLTRPLPSLATRSCRSGRGLASAQVEMPSVVFLNG